MIDWVAFKSNCEPHELLGGGKVASFDSQGEIEWSINKRLEVVGSGSTKIQVRSITMDSYELSGNLTKFFQGHNVFGTDDLQALVDAWDKYSFANGFPMLIGVPELGRVDINTSYRFPTQEEALEWIRWASQSAHWSHRGRGHLHKEGTAYWGQGSRRSSLKAYSKHLEVVSTGKAKEKTPLYEITKGIVRVEATLRGMELKRLNLSKLTEWMPQTANMVLMSMLERLNIPENAPGDSLLDVLPRRLKGVYAEWLHGRDPRKIYPRRTAYRYREALLERGIDIFIPPAEPSKVGSHVPVEHKGWDLRKLTPWQPSVDELAALGYFDPYSYKLGKSA